MNKTEFARKLLRAGDDIQAVRAKIVSRYGCSRAAARAASNRARAGSEAEGEGKAEGKAFDFDEWFESHEQEDSGFHLRLDPELLEIPSASTLYSAWYHVERDEYIFVFDFARSRKHKKHQGVYKFDMPAEEVQFLMEQYTYAGAGKTQKQVCRELWMQFERKMTADFFKWVIAALGIDKNSLPYAPHKFKEEDYQTLVDTWREKEEALVELEKRNTDPEHWKKRALELKGQLTDIEMWLERMPPKPEMEITVPDIGPREGEPKTPVFVFSDWHCGASHRAGADALIAQVEAFVTSFNHPMGDPVILFGGDLLDGVIGDMHPQQAHHQEEVGEAQVLLTQHEVVQVVRYIENRISRARVAYVVGNHDRTSRSHQHDPWRILGRTIMRWCADCTDSHWIHPPEQSNIQSISVGSTQILLYHGDDQPSNWRKLLWQKQDKTADYHLLISGHRHAPELKVSEDTGVMVYRVGSHLREDRYANDVMGLGARASQQVLLIDKFGPHLPGQMML